ncbi:MAG: hypothetical protein NTX50_26330 [Candidatus Sumerlaeota bacterium]|nr:hypothetical protein [Candidatus Sumerlaeota bacterium]
MPPTALRIAVYESEANTAVYKGIHQQPLRQWLEKNGYAFEIIGDKQASDPALLQRYALVMATSCYIIPDAACSGLAKYVADGGRLIWMDGPARCRNKEMLATLGVMEGCSYTQLNKARFRMLDASHFIADGITSFSTQATGNPALKVSGETLAIYSGIAAPRDSSKQESEKIFPAIIVTKTGKGRVILLNWIPWLSRAPEINILLANAVEYLLAERLLQSVPCALRLGGCPREASQPAPLLFSARIIARAQYAGKTATLSAVLLDDKGKPQQQAAPITMELRTSEKGDIAIAAPSITFETNGLPDGEYTIAISGKAGETALEPIRVAVTLNGQALAKLATEQAERAKLLRPLFVGTLGDYDAEPRTKEGRVDIPRLFKQIEAAHMNMYDFLIWHKKTDWEDFQVFAPEAKKRNLKVWITLVPPSEPPPSAPFGLDYLRWADEIGKLSKQHDNIVGVVIDDFWSGGNHSLFTPSYIAKFAGILRGHNPELAFLPTIYWGTIGDEEFIKDYRAALDGIVFPYADLVSTQDLPLQLAACRKWLGPDKLLLINVYASGSSGTREKGPRTAEYMRDILTISREKCDGIRIYCLPKQDFADHRFAITSELYGKWNAKP